MENKIIHISKSGNTKKFSSAIASELNNTKINIRSLINEQQTNFWEENKAIIYWIGSGIYGGHVEKTFYNYFNLHPPPEDSTFAFFAT